MWTWNYTYDGNGNQVIATEGVTTTVYLGNYFEWTTSTANMVKYYYAGSTRVAMRKGTANPLWLLGDHLGSTSLVANYDGTIYINGTTPARQGYKAWGEKRYPAGASPLPTTFRYTGQRESSSLGLYYYGARCYDSYLNRWIQPDANVPASQENPQGFDRYAFVANNPLIYTDPGGHCWGIASAIRGIPSYDTTCNNLDMALTIVQSPNANAGQKAEAGAYIALEAVSHGALITGVAALACSAIASCAAAAEGALGIGANASAEGGSTDAALNAANTAESVLHKLDTYLLDPTHPRGSTMAVWYERALGFTKQNIGDLAKQIVFDPNTAYETAVTQYGTKYNQIISITGANGKFINIVAAWIELPDGTIKLVTTTPVK